MNENPSSFHPLPEWLEHDFAKTKKTLWVYGLLTFLLVLGSLTLVVYGALSLGTSDKAFLYLCLGVFFLVFFSLILIRASLALFHVSVVYRLTQMGAKADLVKYGENYLRKAWPSDRESAKAELASAYLDVDRLAESRALLASIKNPIILEAQSAPRALLLLEEGRYAEAKALALCYQEHHRDGKTESERHVAKALLGLFDALEGKAVDPSVKKDLDEVFDSPLGQRLLASAPWDSAKQGDPALPEALKNAELAASRKLFETNAAVNGTGERRLQPWLSLLLPLVLIVLAACFLGAALSVPQGDEKPLRNMWIMGFSALFALGCLIFAAIARKKEPKDRTLPLLIVSTVVLTLSLLVALTCLS
jgi:hypothetical protein